MAARSGVNGPDQGSSDSLMIDRGEALEMAARSGVNGPDWG